MLLLYVSEWRCDQPNRERTLKEIPVRAVTRHLSFSTRLSLQDALTRLLQYRQVHREVHPDTAIEYRLLMVSTLPDDIKDRTLSMMGVTVIERLPTKVSEIVSNANDVKVPVRK